MKKLVYWIGMIFIVAALALSVVLFLRIYPEVGEAANFDAPHYGIEGLYMPDWFYAVAMGFGICAFGSYIVLALEVRRLRKKTKKTKDGE